MVPSPVAAATFALAARSSATENVSGCSACRSGQTGTTIDCAGGPPGLNLSVPFRAMKSGIGPRAGWHAAPPVAVPGRVTWSPRHHRIVAWPMARTRVALTTLVRVTEKVSGRSLNPSGQIGTPMDYVSRLPGVNVSVPVWATKSGPSADRHAAPPAAVPDDVAYCTLTGCVGAAPPTVTTNTARAG